MESPDFFCNKCLTPMNNCGPPFSLTQCGHIYCHKCIIKVGDHCPSCDSAGIQSMTLGASIPPSIANLFGPLLQMYEQLGSLIKFQSEQYAIVNEAVRKFSKKHDLLKRAYWESRKYLEKEKQELKALEIEYNNLKAEELYVSQQQDNAQATNFLNTDNSYRYQKNPNSAQNYIRDLPQQHTPHYQNHRHIKESRYPYVGYSITPNSGSSTTSMLQGSTPGTSGSPQNIFRIPNMKKAPRFKNST